MTRIVDLDAWRRVCLDAYRNLSTDTAVSMGDVDAVLLAGARTAVLLDTSTTEGATAYGQLIDRVGRVTGVGRDDVGAILTWCAQDAVGQLTEETT